MTGAARIGVLGGTFNPIHHAHLFGAEVAAARLRLDRVLVVPAHHSPLKDLASVSTEDRVAMARLAIAGNPRLEVSTVDVDRPPPSFTVETMSLLAARYSAAELFLILGVDALQDLLKWREPQRLLDLCQVIALGRPGYKLGIPPEVGRALGYRSARIVLQEMPPLGISSTDLRRRLKADEPVRYLLPERVERYIRERGLYGARPERDAIPLPPEPS
jgi:nicotinate-nucleotide adenylyltransferase